MIKDITKFFEELKYKLYTVPKSENVMFRLRLDNYYPGDIFTVPNKGHRASFKSILCEEELFNDPKI